MIKLGLIIQGAEELSWYGLEVDRREQKELIREYGKESEIEILDVCDEVFSGIKIDNPDQPAESELQIKYFFPDEENPDDLPDDRLVDLNRASVIIRMPRRKKCERDNVYLCGGDYRRPYREIRLFETGFLPPFKSEDVTVFLDDLSDFGFDGCILGNIRYKIEDAVFTETDIMPGRRLDSKFLED